MRGTHLILARPCRWSAGGNGDDTRTPAVHWSMAVANQESNFRVIRCLEPITLLARKQMQNRKKNTQSFSFVSSGRI